MEPQLKHVGLFVVLLVVGCGQGPEPLTDSYKASVADTVKQVLDGYSQAVKSLDANRITGYYSDAPGFVLAGNDEYYPSRDSLRRTLQSHLKMLRSIDSLAWIDPRVVVLAEGAATVTTAFYQKVTLTGGTSVEVRGHFTFVLKRGTGGWRFVQVHSSLPSGK